jgi:hypothetical protein
MPQEYCDCFVSNTRTFTVPYLFFPVTYVGRVLDIKLPIVTTIKRLRRRYKSGPRFVSVVT